MERYKEFYLLKQDFLNINNNRGKMIGLKAIWFFKRFDFLNKKSY